MTRNAYTTNCAQRESKDSSSRNSRASLHGRKRHIGIADQNHPAFHVRGEFPPKVATEGWSDQELQKQRQEEGTAIHLSSASIRIDSGNAVPRLYVNNSGAEETLLIQVRTTPGKFLSIYLVVCLAA